MSTLTDILMESIAAVEVPGRPIDTHAAAQYGISKILANAELNFMAVSDWFTGKIQAYLGSKKKRGMPSAADYVMAHRVGMDGGEDITMLVPRQFDLFIDPFDLKDAHMVEGDTGKMQRTRNANLYEFDGFILSRDKKIAADIKYANKMRRARERLTPIWSVEPMMTYEEACNFYVRQHGMPPKDEDESED
jgi:hypothetical protein